jgi:hypothetical protein
MATITGLTAARMQAIEAASIVSGVVTGDDLILSKFNGDTINAGNVRGPIGPTGPDGNPIGTIIMGGWAAEPTNYKFLNGQTLTAGVASYPTIATLFPSWVSSGNLILPNAMAGAVPLGASSGAGVVAGSMSRTLTEAQLFAHTHTGPNHQHGMSHAHGHTLSATQGNHSHPAGGYTLNDNSTANSFYTRVGTSGANYDWYGGGTLTQWASYQYPPTTSASAGAISIGGGVSDFSGNTGFGGTGVTGTTGSSSAIDITPKNLTVKYAIKVL